MALRTLSLSLLFLAVAVAPAEAQTAVTRTPNLSGGWVDRPGTLHFHLVHRFWTVGAGDEEKLMNSPTMFLGVPLPLGFLVGSSYASNSLVAANRFNEWESLVRWAPVTHRPGGVEAAGSVAYNWAAESLDLEAGLAWEVPLPSGTRSAGAHPSDLDTQGARTTWTGPSLRLLASARRLGNVLGGDDAAHGLIGGIVLRLRQGFSLAGDVGRLEGHGAERGTVWGAGIQMQIPTTPHSVSLQASNTRTGTLHGSAVADRTVWGFEFTIPVTPGRYLPRRATANGAEPPAHHAEVAMTHDLRFAPDTLRIQAGQTVLWRNATAVIHTVTLEAADSGDLRPGESFWHTFSTPGIYAYTCVPHDMAGMRGVVVVEP
jgi:plastocyanin